MNNIVKQMLTWYATHVVYRKVPWGCCCCGADMEGHSVWDNHSPRDSKEYAITNWVEEKMK